MKLAHNILDMVSILEEGEGGGEGGFGGDADFGNGTASDLGVIPVYGVNSGLFQFKRKKIGKKKKKVRRRRVNEDNFESSDYSQDDLENAIDVLDNSIDDGLGDDNEEDDSVKPVSIEKILKYKVFKRIRNLHDIKHEAYSENDPIDNELVIAEVTKKDDRYVFASRVLIDNSRKDYIYEGNREEIISFLIVVNAKTYNNDGMAVDIINLVDKSNSPVRIVVFLDSLLTYGVKYAKQIVTK